MIRSETPPSEPKYQGAETSLKTAITNPALSTALNNLTPQLNELAQLGSKTVSFHLPAEALTRVEESFRCLTGIISSSNNKVYGIHTHFGADVKSQVASNDPIEHQRALLEYLSVGVGPAFPDSVVRRALRLQCIKVGKGFSGVHPRTVNELVNLSNREHLPTVPTFGSLGASGDLVPMAHAIAPIFTNGMPRGPRDVLGLVNTNSVNCSFAVELHARVDRILRDALTCTALATFALGVERSAISGGGLAINTQLPFPQRAAALLQELRSSVLKSITGDPLANPRINPESSFPVQERYSVRCAPQILGNAMENFEFASKKIIDEAFALADNPVVLPQDEDGPARMWHGGLFFTSGLATAAEMMHDIVGRCCELLNRQTFLLVDEQLSHGLPRNLQIRSGDHVKGIHQLANALEQSVKAHGVPVRHLSSPAESYNQDVVPCTMAALHALQNMLEPAEHLTRAAQFIARRAAYLRLGRTVPAALCLSAWQTNSFH